ncbi:ESX-1 secretion-associated protein EspI-like [Schistocerca americana]|uniref:ESX-1 secretion-associated protein EspI-like n=1 Tax=Schistocerca americana TaxID=7009 RepID=UPI001F4FE836|nr:ESX-1 secretion-associated protein EspI-like [Schistocerca americana]
MPTHWASSQRPLVVRTVWVRGARHAILLSLPTGRVVDAVPVAGRTADVSPLVRRRLRQRRKPHSRREAAPQRLGCCGYPCLPPPSTSSGSDCCEDGPAADELLGPLSERVLGWLELSRGPTPPPTPPPPAAAHPTGRLRPPRRILRAASLELEPPPLPPSAVSGRALAPWGSRCRQPPPPPPVSPTPPASPTPPPSLDADLEEESEERCCNPRRRQLHIYLPSLAPDCDSASCLSDS